MKRLFLVLSVLIWTGPAYAAMELTMEEAIKLAMTQNENIMQAYEDQASASEKVKEARSALFPTLSASYSYNRYFRIQDIPVDVDVAPDTGADGSFLGIDGTPPGSDNPQGWHLVTQDFPAKNDNEHIFGLNASQVIYTSGRIMNYYRAAKAGSVGADFFLMQKKRKLTFQVQETYLNTLLAREALAIAKASLENTQKDHDIILQKFNEGLAAEVEKMQHEIEVHNRQIGVITAENDLTMAKNYLKMLGGISFNEEIILTDRFNESFPEIAFDDTLTTVLEKEPSINALRQNAKASEYILKAYKAEYYPMVAAFSSMQYDGDSDDAFPDSDDFHTTMLAGISVTIPIYEGGIKSAKKNQAIRNLKKIRLELSKVQKMLTLDLQNTFLAYKASQRQHNTAGQTLNVSQKAYDLAKLRYKTGLGSLSELQDAELALTKAKLLVSKTIRDVNQNLYKIQSYLSNSTRSEP